MRVFVCPVCGSSRWEQLAFYRSPIGDSPPFEMGRCLGLACSFQWDRLNDGHYFREQTTSLVFHPAYIEEGVRRIEAACQEALGLSSRPGKRHLTLVVDNAPGEL